MAQDALSPYRLLRPRMIVFAAIVRIVCRWNSVIDEAEV